MPNFNLRFSYAAKTKALQSCESSSVKLCSKTSGRQACSARTTVRFAGAKVSTRFACSGNWPRPGIPIRENSSNSFSSVVSATPVGMERIAANRRSSGEPSWRPNNWPNCVGESTPADWYIPFKSTITIRLLPRSSSRSSILSLIYSSFAT